MSELLIHDAPHFAMVTVLDVSDIEHFARAGHEYHQVCAMRPFVHRCQLAMSLCSRIFGIPIEDIKAQAPRQIGRAPAIVEMRQKWMAFARVVSLDSDVVNSWKRIGHAFDRHHATVIHATHKYGDQIATALRS